MTTKLKPRLYLQVQDDKHMVLYYSVLSEDGYITPAGPIEGPKIGSNEEIVYQQRFKRTEEGANHVDGKIPNIMATKEGPDKKIIFTAIEENDGVAIATPRDGGAAMYSDDADDRD